MSTRDYYVAGAADGARQWVFQRPAPRAAGICRDCGLEPWRRHGAYAELHALSNFSFLRGASHPAELITRAHALGYRALALTDECSLAGVVRAHEALRALCRRAPSGSSSAPNFAPA
jgi:hypothetical protein